MADPDGVRPVAVALVVNDERRHLDLDPRTTLLDALWERWGLTGWALPTTACWQQVDVIVLPVELDQLGLDVGAPVPRDLPHPGEVPITEHPDCPDLVNFAPDFSNFQGEIHKIGKRPPLMPHP